MHAVAFLEDLGEHAADLSPEEFAELAEVGRQAVEAVDDEECSA